VSLAVDVHQVELVNQTVPFKQLQGPVNRAAIHAGIQPLRPAQKLCRIQMFSGGLHHPQNGATLLGHADSAVGKVGLQAAWHFSLG
jgi:hypothetical protein